MTESKYKARKYGNDTDYNQYPESLAKLKTIFSNMKTKQDKPLRDKTIENYVNKINRLSIIMLGHGYNGDNKFLMNPDTIVEKLTQSGMKSLKDYLSPAVKLLTHLGNAKDKIEKYNKSMIDYKHDEDNKRRDNKATVKEQDLALPLAEIRKKIEDYNIKDKGEIDDARLVYKLIATLYFFNHLIARNNYYNMKIASDKKKNKDFNKNYNYLIVSSNGDPKGFVMLNYKTSNTYGLQKFTITSKILKDTLATYLLQYGKQPGDFLFVDKNGNEFKSDNFSNLVKQSMDKVLGKPLNIDLIRKIHITEFYKSGLKSTNDRMDFAKRFLHSAEMQQNDYMKTDLFEDDRARNGNSSDGDVD
jgi:hypothetical protein